MEIPYLVVLCFQGKDINHNFFHFQIPSNQKNKMMTKPKLQGEGGSCTHCGNMKHARETCFKLNGYPNWWHELKAKKKWDAGWRRKSWSYIPY